MAFDELYRDYTHLPLAQLIRDADTLSKLGPQGIMSFISKWTLRKLPPIKILSKKLTIELTYALNAEYSMLTPQGKNEAKKESELSFSYFSHLLTQWKTLAILDLEMNRINIEDFQIIHVRLVEHDCKHPWSWKYSLSPGVKCTKVQIKGICTGCNIELEEEFCLPLLTQKASV